MQTCVDATFHSVLTKKRNNKKEEEEGDDGAFGAYLSIPVSLGCRYFLDSSSPPPQAAW
jgi:hypothetical protein